MANSYVFPGGVTTYVPTLHQDLIVEYSLNPAQFPINRYIDVRKVDKQKGYYTQMLNDGHGRVVSDTDNVWSDGTDSPKVIEGNDEFTFPQYNCVRRRLPKMLGYLAVEQAGWDILDQAGRFLAQQQMTARVKRVHGTLTNPANWPTTNYATATTLGGGTWATASSSNPYIRNSLAAAQIKINQPTYGVVQAQDLYLVMNPNTAKTVAMSGEFLDFIKQQSGSIGNWEAQQQYRLYGLPDNLLGLNVVVDGTVHNSALPGQTASFSFTFPDNYALLLTKQKAINPVAGGAFSTYCVFMYEDMVSEVYNDAENRRYKLYVTENRDTSVVLAPTSGFLIATNS